jgi:predicted NBD/HSP70 family sugar kinase
MAELLTPPQYLPPRLTQELNLIRKMGNCSRSDLHRLMNCRKNTIGQDVSTLLALGLLRESELHMPPRGRPSVHLEIDPASRHVLGAAIVPGSVSCGRYNLLGHPIETAIVQRVDEPAKLIPTCKKLIRQMISPKTIVTGLSIPGMMEQTSLKILTSSAWPDGQQISLKSLDQQTDHKLVFDNLTNALGTRWLLEHSHDPHHDHLLILLSDGMLGATLLINGRPIQGCITCSNELGHTRMPVPTPKCYCGHTGCLERIFSSAYLKQLGCKRDLCSELVGDSSHPAVKQMTDYLVMGLANAVNFCRPSHVTVMTDLPDIHGYIERLMDEVRKQSLREFACRMTMQHWIEPDAQPAANGAALALAQLYFSSGQE